MVVLDASGGVRALVSTPSYDPHHFLHGISTQFWRTLQDNPYKPLLNRPLSGLYAPGSTIKMAVALAALEAGIITPTTTFSCNGVFMFNAHPFHCWIHGKGGHGALNCAQAIARSCDCFFYETARRVGIEGLAACFKNLGLGERWLQALRESNTGLVPTQAWKTKRFGKAWTPTDTILTGIGQGYVLATPLEIAVMTARLATGLQIQPFMLMSQAPPSPVPALPFSQEHLDVVRRGMVGCLEDPQGNGYTSRIRTPGLQMAGKTGTSQVRRISLADRAHGRTKTTHQPWQYREHALFCAYAPVHAPRYMISVVVEHGGGGGGVAAPIARDILTFAQNLA